MRMIENMCLVNMRSPARHVFQYLHLAIVNLALERNNEFDHELGSFTLIYDDTHLWKLNVNVDSREIRISRKVVEVLWASVYAYFVVYNDVIRYQDPTKQGLVDLTTNDRTSKSCKLLRWAFESRINESKDEWPDDLPMPTAIPEPESEEHVANEFALGAIAFMLHHELSHIRLGHQPPSNIEDEREADAVALDWVFSKADYSNERLIQKKALCCAVGLADLCAFGIHTGYFNGVDHPASYDRLVYGLRRVIEDDCHVSWFFVSAILSLHMTNAGYSMPTTVYDTPYAYVEDIANQLSRGNQLS